MHSSVTPYMTSGRFPNVRAERGSGRLDDRRARTTRRRTSSPSSIATLAGGQLAPIQPPNDGFFEAVTFIGAVPPAPAANWMDGWTSFPQN